jgi:multisubunit Na+/H+ antiporter MnhG subunit
MTRPTTPLLISIGWIGLVLATFVVVEASSLRSWLYLIVIALLPPLLAHRLWNRDPGETGAGLSHITDSK